MPLQKVARFDYGELAPAVEWPVDATEEVKEEEQVGIEEWERWFTAAPSYDAWDSAAGDGTDGGDGADGEGGAWWRWN